MPAATDPPPFDARRTFRAAAPTAGMAATAATSSLVVDPGMTTLGDYHRHRHFRAKPGGKGARRRAHGRNGAGRELPVPPGTVVRLAADDEDG